MDSSSSSSGKSNKIRDIVRLQQILKKWKKVANNNKSSRASTSTTKSITFLKKTLSFSESSTSASLSSVPKGYMAVCVGKEEKRFVIPTEHLSHQLFAILLREAEEEFGFQQEGVLKFPCEVHLFEKILRSMDQDKRSSLSSSQSSPSLIMLHHPNDIDDQIVTCNNCSPDTHDQLTTHHHPAQTCR